MTRTSENVETLLRMDHEKAAKLTLSYNLKGIKSLRRLEFVLRRFFLRENRL